MLKKSAFFMVCLQGKVKALMVLPAAFAMREKILSGCWASG